MILLLSGVYVREPNAIMTPIFQPTSRQLITRIFFNKCKNKLRKITILKKKSFQKIHLRIKIDVNSEGNNCIKTYLKPYYQINILRLHYLHNYNCFSMKSKS